MLAHIGDAIGHDPLRVELSCLDVHRDNQVFFEALQHAEALLKRHLRRGRLQEIDLEHVGVWLCGSQPETVRRLNTTHFQTG